MLKKRVAAIVLITGFVGGLISCTSQVDRAARENEIAMHQGFSPKGTSVFLNPKNGEVIVACEARKERGLTECLTEIRKDDSGNPVLYFTSTGKPVMEPKMIETMTYVWKGSHCQTSSVGGQRYENCLHWPPLK